ncbi:MAG: ABC transporter permease [Flavobacteriales bacterium]|nr:ABC transporter permease [Flavobacteriales bacterium]
MGILFHIGRYLQLMQQVFGRPEHWGRYARRMVEEMDRLGVRSLGLVALMSVFMGAVITLQTSTNIDAAWIPKYVVGFTARQSIILEFSPTIISLILAGKVGSNIAAEIGTMRVNEQIDALDIMGINSASYLILPKIVAAMLIFPFLIVISMFLGIFGGWVVSILTGVVGPEDFIQGLQWDFDPYTVTYALIKTVVFAFIITSVSAYHGYFTKGGALEVGRSSTTAVVFSSIVILIANYLLTQILLI